MEPGLESADRDVEDSGRLGIRQPEVVVDHEHGTLLGGQPTKASLQLVPYGGQLLRVTWCPCVGHRHLDLHDAALPDPPCLPIAGVDQEPIEPGVEPVRVAHGADVQPGGQERVLDRVSRLIVASEDQPCGPVQPRERCRGEGREGLVVTVPSSEDEVSLHRTPGLWRPTGRRHPS
jgi:hypothetical protein